MSDESAEKINDGLLAIADSVDKLIAAVLHTNRPTEQTIDSPLKVTVASVTDASGWRVLLGELRGSEIIYTHLPMLSWAIKINHAIGGDDILQVPLIWDADHQRGMELDSHLEQRRYISPGISARLLAPGQDSLSAEDVADFEAEIRDFYCDTRREMAAETANRRIATQKQPAKSQLAN